MSRLVNKIEFSNTLIAVSIHVEMVGNVGQISSSNADCAIRCVDRRDRRR
jgi:hypothetical protein